MERKGERRRDEQHPETRRAPPSSIQGSEGDSLSSLDPAEPSALAATTLQQQLLQIQARQIMQTQRSYNLPTLMQPVTASSDQLTRYSQPNIMTTSRAWPSYLPANSMSSNFSLQLLQLSLSQHRFTGLNQHQQHAYNIRQRSYLSILEETYLPPAGTQSSYVTGSNVAPVVRFLPNPRHHREALFSANDFAVTGNEIAQHHLPPMINSSLQAASRQDPSRAAATPLNQPRNKPGKRITGKDALPAAVESQDAHPRQAEDRFSCPPGRVEVEVKARRRYSHECFPEKLHRLLREVADEGNDHIIAWLPDGNGFEIHSLEAFENFIIPAYFRHQKLASFRRQLSMYGFRRDSSKQDARRYVHLRFHRDHPERCKSVKRLSDYQLVLKKKKT